VASIKSSFVFEILRPDGSQVKLPPGEAPVTTEQKQTHREVSKKQKILKQKLEEGASPEEIGKAKADVQKKRVDANAADAAATTAPSK
jgi:hypothetical protein